MYELCSSIEDIEGVTLVHDVHAWTITTGYNAMAAHILIIPNIPVTSSRLCVKCAAWLRTVLEFTMRRFSWNGLPVSVLSPITSITFVREH